MRISFLSLLFVLFLSTMSQTYAQVLPMDSAVCYGKLDNGLTYYIRHNERPKGHAEFYIVQRVGSILEEEDQRGLAHFLEHMAFNGTKNFPKKRLIEYLEENGVKFGTDINAYTAFEQTVYNISNVPTEREGVVDSCLLILHDWSGFITLNEKEIDAERKVIHEEWRLKTGAQERIYEQTLPKLFPNNHRYAQRMPIGKMEVVDNFPYSTLREYYRKWYRPDLQAIIVVGDIDVSTIEKRIREMWADIPERKQPAERIYYSIAHNATPIVAIGTDPELTSGMLRISFKYTPTHKDSTQTKAAQRERFCNSMIVSMLSARINDFWQKASSYPNEKIYFTDGDYSIAAIQKAFSVTATFEGDRWKTAMQTLVLRLKQAMAHGFTQAEYKRMEKEIAKAWIHLKTNQRGRSNKFHVEKCIDHFLSDVPLLSDSEQNRLYQEFLSEVSLEELNARFNQILYSRDGVAILLQGQLRDKHQWPTEAELLQAYNNAWLQETVPYEIPKKDPPPVLMQTKPQAGSIIRMKQNQRYGTTELTLSNGAKVILKPTEIPSNELILTAISQGGTSLLKDEDYNHFSAINVLPSMGGLGNLSGEQLGLALEGSTASYQTNIGTLNEKFAGGCKWEHAEQLLQLLHLRFTTVRKNEHLFASWQKNRRNALVQQMGSPMTHFSDTLRNTMYMPHPRNRKLSLALADSVDYDRTCELFLERFANAADFTFIFVGKMDVDSLSSLVCQYIAALPGNPHKQEEANLKALPKFKQGKQVCHLQVPMQQPATTVIYNIWTKERYTQRNNMACAILNEILNTLCTEKLREEEGGTYNVSVTSRISRQPKDELALMFNFSTNPEQAQTLLNQAVELLAQVAEKGPAQELFDNACKYLIKQHDSYRNTNAFWMEALVDKVLHNSEDMLTNNQTLREVTPKDVQRLARKLTKSSNTAEIIMYPQK